MIVIIMNQLIDKFKIKTNNNLYNLNDIVTNVIKSKNVPLYINKIKNKKKILSQFYVDENEFISILNKGKSKSCKEALNLFNNTKDIPKNNLDLQNNLLSFNGYKFLYFSVNDDIWFKGKDIATILEYEKTRNAIIDHVLDEDKKKFEKLGINNINLCSYKIHPNTIFINKKGLESLVIGTRKPISIKFAKFLNINVNQKYPVKECEILNYIIDFLNERSIKYELQKSIGSYFLDMYLPEYNLNIEIDEYGHKDRCPEYEKNREDFIKLSLNCKILRFNPDDKNDNIFKFLGRLSKFDGLYESEFKEINSNINNYINYENKIEDYRDEIISQDTDDVQLKIQREITRQKEYSLKEKEYSLKEKEYSLKEKELELLINLVNKYDGKYLEELVKKYINMSNHTKEEFSIIKDDDTSSMTESKDTNVDMMNVDYDINSNDTSFMTESKDTNMDMMNVDNDISHNDISQPMDIDQEHQLKSISETKSNVYKKKKVKKTKEKNVKKCIDCNIDVFRKSLRCLKCENKRRFEANMSGRPSNEQIRNDLQTMTFVAVGKKYGVSDNCIRKWLSKYERYNNLKSSSIALG